MQNSNSYGRDAALVHLTRKQAKLKSKEHQLCYETDISEISAGDKIIAVDHY
ncbi:MAG: hypothetical protein U0W24_09580 [Bacteroidales bacterium]